MFINIAWRRMLKRSKPLPIAISAHLTETKAKITPEKFLAGGGASQFRSIIVLRREAR